MSQPMKGLVQFIADLRNARAHEAETKRINTELANIRSKFRDPSLSGYQKKKYICKLIYIYILGYNVDFGHAESVSLISSNKYSEKQIGYLSITLLLNENDHLLDMIVNSVRKDLDSLNDIHTCLALNCVATVGGRTMGLTLADDIFKLLISPTSTSFVRKKAALTLLRLYRRDSSIVAPNWAQRIMVLLDDPDLGVAISVVSLVIALAKDDVESYRGAQSKIVRRLHEMLFEKGIPPEYVYYDVPAPWLVVKLLKALSYFPPSTDETVSNATQRIVDKLIKEKYGPIGDGGHAVGTKSQQGSQHHNAHNAVLFESIKLAIHLDFDERLLDQIVGALGTFLDSSESNVRYLALDCLAGLASRYDSLPLKDKLSTVLKSLKDRDVSVRRKAIDLMYCLTDASSVKIIVNELLKFLATSDSAMREDMVIRIAVLVEKYAQEFQWYVDISLRLINLAGAHVSDEVWQRTVMIIVNNESLQSYSARTVLSYLKSPQTNEAMIRVGGYILGEYGHLIADEAESSPIEQFLALHDKFSAASVYTKGLLLSTYVKFVNLFAEIRPQLIEVFEYYSTSIDTEVQQRAFEYLNLSKNLALLAVVCDEMPPFPERSSALLTRLHDKYLASEDKRSWVLGNKDGQVDKKAITTNSTGQPSENHNAPPVPPQRKLENLYTSGWEKGYRDTMFSHNGILYEDSLIRVSLKSEYRKHLGCVILIFTNLSGSMISSFSSDVTNLSPDDEIQVSTKNFPESSIYADSQTQHIILLNARQPFAEGPSVKISFLAGSLRTINVKLPVTLEKFMSPTNLPSEEFFKRWKQLGKEDGRESQRIFRHLSGSSLPPIEDDHQAISDLNWSDLVGVDKTDRNFVGASVVHTSIGGNIGCLIRVEPNENRSMYRVTVRSTDPRVAPLLARTLFNLYQL